MLAGFGEADITPNLRAKPVYMAGFGQNRKATGVHDPLKARAVVLAHGRRKIALVCVDLVGFFLPDVEKVRARLSGFDYVMVSSTHNHEGPDTLGLWGPAPLVSGVDAEYMGFVRLQIVKAVRAADAARKPVTAHFGHHVLAVNKLISAWKMPSPNPAAHPTPIELRRPSRATATPGTTNNV